VPSKYDPSSYAYALGLFEDGRRHLVMRDEIPLLCPVRLLHGMLDDGVLGRRAFASPSASRAETSWSL